MSRQVKHFSLHRVDGTELRVVSDVEIGVLPVIQEEQSVIQGYIQSGLWHHQCVTLFVLQDLQPLVRQIQPAAGTFMGKADVLDNRPVVNVYDLAEPSGCQVFINWEVMSREGYWDDPVAVRGLLAHEHAHPLAEGETTQASRGLGIDLKIEQLNRESMGPQWTEAKDTAVRDILNVLVHKLCLYAPREVFANELTIRSGFGDALLHLNRLNLANARSSVVGRANLLNHFQRAIIQGNLTTEAADLLLLIGDLQGYIDLALEVAPFYRSGRESDARDFEAVLQEDVFSHLEPELRRAYAALVKHYIGLQPELTRDELLVWCGEVLNILTETLAAKGLKMSCEMRGK